MSKGKLIGHINCPFCGTKDGMRITEDKNGAPFGYCEADCDGQIRVGGKVRRVEKFFSLYPHLRREPDAPPAGGAVPDAPGKPDASETAKPAATPAAPTQPPKLPGLGFSLGGLKK